MACIAVIESPPMLMKDLLMGVASSAMFSMDDQMRLSVCLTDVSDSIMYSPSSAVLTVVLYVSASMVAIQDWTLGLSSLPVSVRGMPATKSQVEGNM